MSGKDISVIDAAIQKLRWHEARQKVLAQNIANADTAGYRPKDLKSLEFKDLLKASSSKLSLSPTATSSKHLSTNSASTVNSSSAFKPFERKAETGYGTSPSGNSVSLEEELLKMNQNYTDHRLTTTIYQKNIDLLRKAVQSN